MKDIKVGSIVVCINSNDFIKEGAIGLVVSVEASVLLMHYGVQIYHFETILMLALIATIGIYIQRMQK